MVCTIQNRDREWRLPVREDEPTARIGATRQPDAVSGATKPDWEFLILPSKFNINDII